MGVTIAKENTFQPLAKSIKVPEQEPYREKAKPPIKSFEQYNVMIPNQQQSVADIRTAERFWYQELGLLLKESSMTPQNLDNHEKIHRLFNEFQEITTTFIIRRKNKASNQNTYTTSRRKSEQSQQTPMKTELLLSKLDLERSLQEKFDWGQGFNWKGMYFKQVISHVERKQVKRRFKMLKYFAVQYLHPKTQNFFYLDEKKVHILLPFFTLVEDCNELYYAQPSHDAPLNSISDFETVSSLRRYQELTPNFIVGLVSLFKKIVLSNAFDRNVSRLDRFYVVNEFNYPSCWSLSSQMKIPQDTSMNIQIQHILPQNHFEYREYFQAQVSVKQDLEGKTNPRATTILCRELLGDVTLTMMQPSWGFSINFGMIIDNGLLESEILRRAPSNVLSKALLNAYKKQLETFSTQLDSSPHRLTYGALCMEFKRMFLKQVHAWFLYMKATDKYYKQCFACLIVVNAIKKYVSSDLKSTLISLITSKLWPLEQVLFLRFLHLSPFFPIATQQQIAYLTSPQLANEIVMQALQSGQLLVAALELKFNIRFKDPILRKIRSDSQYFFYNDDLKLNDMYYGPPRAERYFSERDRMFNSLTQQTDMLRAQEIGEIKLPYQFYTYQSKQKSGQNQTLGELQVLDEQVLMELQVLQLLSTWDEDSQQLLIQKSFKTLTGLRQIRWCFAVAITSLNAFMLETSSPIGAYKGYILSLLIVHQCYGDSRGRGVVANDWEVFVVNRLFMLIYKHSKSKVEMEIIQEILHCARNPFGEDYFRGKKFGELRSWFLQAFTNLIDDGQMITSQDIRQYQSLIDQIVGTVEELSSLQATLDKDYWSADRAPGQMITWGYNSNGQLGLLHKYSEPDKLRIQTPRLIPYLKNEIIISVSCAHQHTLVLDQQGQIWAWGANDQMQCAQAATIKNVYVPTRVQCSKAMAQIACGHDHSVSLCRGGRVYAWGSGEGGLLGNGSLQSSQTPSVVQSLESIVQIQCGGLHTMAIDQQGVLWAWGRGEGRQLGLEQYIVVKDERFQWLPARVKLEPVMQVALGETHSIALTSDHKLYGWGYSNTGQLGLGITDDCNEGSYVVEQPTLVDYLAGIRIVKVYAGSLVSLFLSDKYELYSCGLSDQFQSGQAKSDRFIQYKGKKTPSYALPIKIDALQYVLDVSAGFNHALCVTSHFKRHKLYSWGINKQFQLGRGDDTIRQAPPDTVPLNLSYSSIGVGVYHSTAVIGDVVQLLKSQRPFFDKSLEYQISNSNYPNVSLHRV